MLEDRKSFLEPLNPEFCKSVVQTSEFELKISSTPGIPVGSSLNVHQGPWFSSATVQYWGNLVTAEYLKFIPPVPQNSLGPFWVLCSRIFQSILYLSAFNTFNHGSPRSSDAARSYFQDSLQVN